MSKLQKAIEFAREEHKGQLRKDGLPFVSHPLAVLEILQNYGFEGDVLVAAVLHDVCEDSDTKNIEIRDLFGERVGFIVNALTKNPKPKHSPEMVKKFEELKEEAKKYNTFEKYLDYRFHMYINRFYVGIIADPWIMFVKIADQIHNLQTLDSLRLEKRVRKIFEMRHYFLPMYQRAEILITPMYMEKYKKILTDFELELDGAEKRAVGN